MRKFKFIQTRDRKESLSNTFGNPQHNRILLDNTPFSPDFDFLLNVLQGFQNISFKAIERGCDGKIILASEKDINKFKTLKEFYNNDIALKGVFFSDLTAIEASLFQDKDIVIQVLSLPYSSEDQSDFSS